MQTRTMQADAETEKTFGALQDCVGQAGRVTPQLMTAVLDAVHAHSATLIARSRQSASGD